MTARPATAHRVRHGGAWPALSLRLALVVAAARQAVVGAGELFGCTHPAVDLACWQLAASVGLLTVATQPRTAEALLPPLIAAGVLTAVVTVRDVADGATTPGREAGHLWFEVALAMVIALWALLQSNPSPATDARPTPHQFRPSVRPERGLTPTDHPSPRCL